MADGGGHFSTSSSSGKSFATTCVTDLTTTTLIATAGPRTGGVPSNAYSAGDAVPIAAQCCTSSGTCKRYIGSSNEAGCIAGHFGDGVLETVTTFAEAKVLCQSHGLQLCDKLCSGQGCSYDDLPVWTNIPCPVIPAPGGVQALDGGNSDFPTSTCVTDPTTTHANDNTGSSQPIAAQCCTSSGTCKRWVGTNDEAGCVAGSNSDGVITATTYQEAAMICAISGLEMCTTNCAGDGCAYNSRAVWTSLTCEAQPPPPLQPTPLSPPPPSPPPPTTLPTLPPPPPPSLPPPSPPPSSPPPPSPPPLPPSPPPPSPSPPLPPSPPLSPPPDWPIQPFSVVITGAGCTDHGYADIMTLADCSAAAEAIGWGIGMEDTTASDDGQTNGLTDAPPYCYYDRPNHDLKFNAAGSNTGGCTSSDYCMCWKVFIPPPSSPWPSQPLPSPPPPSPSFPSSWSSPPSPPPCGCSSVRVTGGEPVVPDSMGVFDYMPNIHGYFGKPVYRKMSATEYLYLYYLPTDERWHIGPSHGSPDGNVRSVGTYAACPTDLPTWSVRADLPSSCNNWCSGYEFAVTCLSAPLPIHTCGTSALTIAGAENIQGGFMGTYEKLALPGTMYNGGKPIYYKAGTAGTGPAFIFYSEHCTESDSCGSFGSYTSDGVCDDGGTGSPEQHCNFGEDCTDCGPRGEWLVGSDYTNTAGGFSIYSESSCPPSSGWSMWLQSNLAWTTAYVVSVLDSPDPPFSTCPCKTVFVSGPEAGWETVTADLMGGYTRLPGVSANSNTCNSQGRPVYYNAAAGNTCTTARARAMAKRVTTGTYRMTTRPLADAAAGAPPPPCAPVPRLIGASPC